MPPQPPLMRIAAVPGAINLTVDDLALTDIVGIANGGPQIAQTTLEELQAFFVANDATPVANYAALIALTARPAYVLLEGYLTLADGGGGIFVWVANSATTADSGLVVQCTSGPAGRYKRLFSGSISPKWFGCALGGANDSVQFAKVIAAGYAIDASNCVLPVKNLNITSATTCPGIYSDGTGSFTVPTGSVYPDLTFNISKDDFYLKNLSWTMPISGTSTRPAFDRAAYFRVSNGSTGKRWRVEKCRFVGGNGAFSFAGVCQDVRVLDSTFEDTWTDTVDLNAPINCIVDGNIFKRGCLWDGAGVLAISGSSVLGPTENLIITNNVFQDGGINNPANLQDAIDMYGIAIRNCVIGNNVIDNCGSGMELKTSQGTPTPSPDVYNNFNISGNVIRLVQAKSGISLNLTSPVPALTDRTGRVKISGNFITSDTMPAHSDSFFGLGVTGAYWDLDISDNKLLNLNRGVQLGSTAAGAGATSRRVTISSNIMECADICIQGAGVASSEIDELRILDNNMRSNFDKAMRLLSITMNGLIIKGNYAESQTQAALEMSDAHDGEVFGNILIGARNAVILNSDAFAACSNIKIQRNSVTTHTVNALDAFLISTGTGISILNNSVDVPVAKRVVSGAGTYISAGNTRGTVAADPSATTAGSLGDIFLDSTAATAGWRCTTAGNVGAATYTVI